MDFQRSSSHAIQLVIRLLAAVCLCYYFYCVWGSRLSRTKVSKINISAARWHWRKSSFIKYPLSFRDLYRLFTRNQLLPTAKNQLPQASTALQVTVRKKRWRVLSELRQFKTCYIKMFFYKFEIFEENRFLLIESFDFQFCFYQ